MIRIAVYSRSDAFHHGVSDGAKIVSDLRIEFRLRSDRRLEIPEYLDALVVDEPDPTVVERILDGCAPVPVLIVDADQFSSQDVGRWSERVDGWAEMAGHDPERIIAAVRAVAMGFLVFDAELRDNGHTRGEAIRQAIRRGIVSI